MKYIKQIQQTSKTIIAGIILIHFMYLPLVAQNFLTVFEKSKHLETSTYKEGIEFYKRLAVAYPQVQLLEKGITDSGLPLHLVLISKSGSADIAELKSKGKAVVLINNAIHPGEPDGVEASQMLARNLVTDNSLASLLDNTVVAIIPFYNIGGVLNRNSTTRVNQVGPKAYGFRGNANNYDLNRDFIKADTRNTKAFSQLFQELDPDVFIDTHVSNGADYQYVSTTLPTQPDKLGGALSQFLTQQLLPWHFNYMAKAGTEMTPYVNVWGMNTPDKGYDSFIDLPRYSSGYAALFHTLGFMSETHMLKPFEQRVQATYNYLLGLLYFTHKNANKILTLRTQAKQHAQVKKAFVVSWQLDKTMADTLMFKGFEAEKPISQITGKERLKYNRSKPYAKAIPYYNHYKPLVVVTKPDYYIIPKSQWRIIERLKMNAVELQTVKDTTVLPVEVYHIAKYKTRTNAFEGHYPHYNVDVTKINQEVTFVPGDVMVPVNQWRNRYIVETLEPQASDSFFNWNFFDTILQQKEGFSAYVFEDLAMEILASNPKLKAEFNAKKVSDSSFNNDAYAQLLYIYNHSNHLEKAYLRYPVYRYTR